MLIRCCSQSPRPDVAARVQIYTHIYRVVWFSTTAPKCRRAHIHVCSSSIVRVRCDCVCVHVYIYRFPIQAVGGSDVAARLFKYIAMCASCVALTLWRCVAIAIVLFVVQQSLFWRCVAVAEIALLFSCVICLVVSQSIFGVVSQSPFFVVCFLSLCRNHYMALCRNRRTRANGVAHRPRYFSAARPWILLYRGAACALIRSGARTRRAIRASAMSVVRTTWDLRSCARRDKLITRYGAVGRPRDGERQSCNLNVLGSLPSEG